MTLRLKLNLFFVLLLLVSNGIIGYTAIQKVHDLLSTHIQRQSDSIISLITHDAVNLVLLDSPEAAHDIREKLRNLPNLESIRFYDIKQHSILELVNKPSSNTTVTKHTELNYKGHKLGSITLQLSGEQKHNLISELYSHLLQVFLLSLLMIAVLTSFIDRFFTQRITKLNRALQKTAESNHYDTSLPEESHDEIGQAYRHFNILVNNTSKLTQDLMFQIDHDPLTGVYSRAFMSKKIASVIRSNEGQLTRALCLLSFDKFKIINDTFGHQTGDQFMINVTEKLKEHCQDIPHSWLGRAGSDEFILLIEEINEIELKTQLTRLIQTIKDYEMAVQQQHLSIGLSIGAILFKDAIDSKQALLGAADSACNQSKQLGGNYSTLYWLDSKDLHSERQAVKWVHEIRKAIKQNTLQVYLQPIIANENITHVKPSYEALVRYKKGDKITPPYTFIPTLERYGLMHELDYYMISEVLRLMNVHRDWLNEINHISINISALTLNIPDVTRYVIKQIEKHRIPYSKVCFEITETAALANMDHAKFFIKELKFYGCKFSLDDFGTGMATFDYLYNLPINYLKIDGSFIKDIEKDPVKEEMVRAMQNIAELMKLETVAEYVEDENIIEMLNNIGITYHQGYYYSAPRPFEEFVSIQEPSSV